ncbi:hypothetical protein Lal_00021600 [Lupinus albus]|nr:hypothetical protein Lal_00021600 [Lupinus albus]
MGHETLLLPTPSTTTTIPPPPPPLSSPSGSTALVVVGAASSVPSPTSLAPGFRFHPTDEELVIYYLKRKVGGKSFRFDAISEVDIYRSEPWDLADKSRLKTRDQEWYFFSALDKKYGNGGRMNRATNKGYWKATGNDRPVRHEQRTVGLKKTLVFHSGRAPDGKRTNWVMHEYRLVDEELEKARTVNGSSQDAFVLCRVFHKNNIGPPNGQRYAPFVEEEWDDESGLVPGEESAEPISVVKQPSVNDNGRVLCIEGRKDVVQHRGIISTCRGFGSYWNGMGVSCSLVPFLHVSWESILLSARDAGKTKGGTYAMTTEASRSYKKSFMALPCVYTLAVMSSPILDRFIARIKGTQTPFLSTAFQKTYASIAEIIWWHLEIMIRGYSVRFATDWVAHDLVQERRDTQSVNKAPFDVNKLPIETQNLLAVCKRESMAEFPSPEKEDSKPMRDDFPSPQSDNHKPFSQIYKRRRHNLNNHLNVSGESIRTSQDPCSSTITTAATTLPMATTIANPTTTNTAPKKHFLSALVEFSLMESLESKEVQPPEFDADNLESTVSPSCMKFIKHLQSEVQKLSIEREAMRFEMMSAQAMINILQSRIDHLNKENEELKMVGNR